MIGAVALGTYAEPPGARESGNEGRIPMAPPGVYLLAYTGNIPDEWKEESGTVSLMSVSVDNDGNPAYQQFLGVPAVVNREIVKTYAPPPARVQFPGDVGASDNDPARRGTVTLTIESPGGLHSYRFKLDLYVFHA